MKYLIVATLITILLLIMLGCSSQETMSKPQFEDPKIPFCPECFEEGMA